ncbi:hypothetical protein F511_33564 [Dorcoceras hygrometricum]|uniref:Uncharacterized protein n=1 Tax=Dorcoceras hygrometricum TaxID=472368 RepID=A0A2Z7ADT1_9LAMI|nr:hypothetical protein F511_33564 [Dorcoceras hygrometricum]
MGDRSSSGIGRLLEIWPEAPGSNQIHREFWLLKCRQRYILLIRSTTGNKNPPSVCTRRADEFCHGRNHLEKTIRTSPITAAAEARREAVHGGAGAAAVRWSREGGRRL